MSDFGIESAAITIVGISVLIGLAIGVALGWWARGKFLEWQLGKEIDKNL